jgi:DMSO/TMAO reductase YedYZ molybdopterin-dependent catalytic subunit
LGLDSYSLDVVRSSEPFNAETDLASQTGVITPTDLFYVRNHFAPPKRWDRLTIAGNVRRPMALALEDLMALPARTLRVTMECAGNGRAYLQPPAPGVQWRLGAVGTADWTGVPLRIILDMVGIGDTTTAMVFGGVDKGVPDKGAAAINYERSLNIEKAIEDDVLVAWGMNGHPLPFKHGGPVRLVVPGWYGMASVKWLTRISAIKTSFRGYFQVDDYVVPERGNEPCESMAVRSVIASPVDGSHIRLRQPVTVRGYAWSGQASIDTVEMSTDSGKAGPTRTLSATPLPIVWSAWTLAWYPDCAGEITLLCRATDSSGASQPLDNQWNSTGYCNNGAQPVKVRVI